MKVVYVHGSMEEYSDLPISPEDMSAYLDVVDQALVIHLDRETMRHGLWKKYPPREQMFNIRVKTERIMSMLERIGEGEPTEEDVEYMNEELYDIINYAIFTSRKLEGE